MFGYVRYDFPNLYIKDYALYQAAYCGLCKGIAASCGQKARLGLTYDVTFLSLFLHNLLGEDIKIEKQHCFEHAVRGRPIAVVDPLTKELGALNTVLTYYKLSDDVQDKKRGRVKRHWFKAGFKRAKKKYPELVILVEDYMKAQANVEKENSPSPDAAADPTANMMVALSRKFLGEKATEATDEFFYALGKWVYLIDALDDYEKDFKRKSYNPFVLSYGGGTKKELMEQNGEEITFLFDTVFYNLREGLGGMRFSFNRDLTDNVILRGIPLETKRVFLGEKRKKATVK